MIPAHNLAETDDQIIFPNLAGGEPYVAEFHDGTVKLYLDTNAFDFHLDASARALPSVIEGYVNYARRLGFMPMPYDECEPELMSNGYVRVYMVPIEPVTDVRFEMPSLAETAFGPFSMEIPVVGPEMIAADLATDTLPRIDLRPPLPYVTKPATYEQQPRTMDATRRGRHRAKP